MPVTAEETLAKLVEAADEAKATIRELHEARAAALDVVKSQRAQVHAAIEQLVKEAVGTLGREAEERMKASVERVIRELAADWREKLGLDPAAV